MSVPTVPTFTSNETLLSSDEQLLSTALNFLLSPPLAELRRAAAQSIASGGFAAVSWDTGDKVNDSMWTSGTRITFNTAGRYRISGKASFVSNTTGRRAASWFVNGTEMNGGRNEVAPLTGGIPTYILLPSRNYYFNAGDYLELQVFQSSGGALNTSNATSDQCSASVDYRAIS